MDSMELNKRTHFWLRVGALAVIAAAAWIPRGWTSSGSNNAAISSADGTAIHASVTGR